MHEEQTFDQMKEFWQSLGLPEDYAVAMNGLEHLIAIGEEEAHFHAKVKEVGKIRLADYFKANREVWIPK